MDGGSTGVASDDDTRNTILDHAERLFFRDGYAATTMQRIAKHAGLPVETVSKVFPSKYRLMRALRDRALYGTGAAERSDEMRARETDLRAIFHNWAAFSKEVSPRVSPVLLLIREASVTDRDMEALRKEWDDARLERMAANAARVEELGIKDRDRARDIMWLLTSPEVYDLLVVKRGWSIDAYGEFIEQVLGGTL
jgi:AcrR family transcriptional regulator